MRTKYWFLGGMLLLLATACTQPVKPPAGEGENPVVSFDTVQIPPELKDSLRGVVDSYLGLSGALAARDTLLVDAFAGIMIRQLDSLPLYGRGLDSAHAQALEANSGSIAAELTGMRMEQAGLDGRRISFFMASEQLYDLLLQTGAPGQSLFRFYCPEAMGGQGAYWLAGNKAAVNPYTGDTTCVQLKDTVR